MNNTMNTEPSGTSGNRPYWWIFYILLFLFCGLLISILLRGCGHRADSAQEDFSRIHAQLDSLEKLVDCACSQVNLSDTVFIRDDSLRVIDAGGDFGCLSFTLFWDSPDDIDLAVVDPYNDPIWFQNNCLRLNNGISQGGGQLQIDRNVISWVLNPVEHILFKCGPEFKNGPYRVFVNLYNRRSAPGHIPYTLIIRKSGLEVKRIEGTVSIENNANPFSDSFVMDFSL
jgi:hypothetical protein